MRKILVVAALCATGLAQAQTTTASIGAATLSFVDLNSADGITPAASLSYYSGAAYGYYATNSGLADNGPGAFLPQGTQATGYFENNGASSRAVSAVNGPLRSTTDPLGFVGILQPIIYSRIDAIDNLRYTITAFTRVVFSLELNVLENGGMGYANISFSGQFPSDGCAFTDSITTGIKTVSWSCDTGDAAKSFYLDRRVGTSKSVLPSIPVPAVPEPTTWALLLGAMGVVGARVHMATSKLRSV